MAFRLGVCVFSFAAARPPTMDDLLALAHRFGLQSVEADVKLLGAAPHTRRQLEKWGLRCVVAGGQLLRTDIVALLQTAHAVGASVVRLVLSGVLEGERYKVDGGNWHAHLQRCAHRLREIAPLLERYGVALALENHQDATAEELVWLCEQAGSPLVGVCLDTGNPLAVLQHPVTFAKTVAPWVRDVHLKDYQAFQTMEGFCLKRCPLGAGIVDFAGILRALAAQRSDDLPLHIELGAVTARHIRWRTAAWWQSFPADHRKQAAEALALIERRALTGDWRTPHERGADGAMQRAVELDEFAQSVAFAQTLLGRSEG